MANENIKNKAPQAEEQKSGMEAALLNHRKTIIYVVAAIILIIVGCILYSNLVKGPREDKASTILAKGQEYFDNGATDKALNGDGAGFPGFVKIASDYGSTDAGNLASLYAGLSYAQMGKWQEAVNYLEKFSGSSKDEMITPAAKAALGNAYANLKQYDKAVSLLKEAASKADNNSLSPTFLIQAGEILESQGKKAEALDCYKQVKEKYRQSMAYQTIDAYIERVSE